MTEARRKEMQRYKQAAIEVETRLLNLHISQSTQNKTVSRPTTAETSESSFCPNVKLTSTPSRPVEPKVVVESSKTDINEEKIESNSSDEQYASLSSTGTFVIQNSKTRDQTTATVVVSESVETTQTIETPLSLLCRRKRPRKYFDDDENEDNLESDTDCSDNNNKGGNISFHSDGIVIGSKLTIALHQHPDSTVSSPLLNTFRNPNLNLSPNSMNMFNLSPTLLASSKFRAGPTPEKKDRSPIPNVYASKPSGIPLVSKPTTSTGRKTWFSDSTKAGIPVFPPFNPENQESIDSGDENIEPRTPDKPFTPAFEGDHTPENRKSTYDVTLSTDVPSSAEKTPQKGEPESPHSAISDESNKENLDVSKSSSSRRHVRKLSYTLSGPSVNMDGLVTPLDPVSSEMSSIASPQKNENYTSPEQRL